MGQGVPGHEVSQAFAQTVACRCAVCIFWGPNVTDCMVISLPSILLDMTGQQHSSLCPVGCAAEHGLPPV